MSQNAEKAAEVAMGALAELGRQGGQNLGSVPHGTAKAGEMLVKGAAVVAPGVVASASAGTAATMAAASAAATVLAPVAVVTAGGYGVYKLAKWLSE